MAKLGECFSVIRNGASIRQTDGAGGFPITRIETIADKTINREKFGYAEIYDLAQYRDYILQDGDILMSHINSEKHLGKVALYSKQDDEQIIHGMNLLMLRADTQKVIPEYAKYYFESQKFLRQIGRITKKSVNQASFTVTALKELEIPLVSIIVQRDISEKLKKVDWLVSLRKQQLAKLDELVKARFVEMFGESEYPCNSLISLIIEGAGLSYGIVQPGDDGTGDMGVLRPVDFADGKIKTDSIKYIDRSLGNGFKKTELNGNELLITVRGTTGITALTDSRFKGMNVTRGIAVIRYDKKKVDPIYLNEYIKMEKSQQYIKEHTRGATLQQINLSELRDLEIVIPPLPLQRVFATFVERVDQQKQTVQQSLEKLELMKKALMQEYFG